MAFKVKLASLILIFPFSSIVSANVDTWEVDSTTINKQVKVWTANGLVKQEETQEAQAATGLREHEEAQGAQEDKTNICSVGECGVGENAEDANPGASRVRKKPAWAKDYILE